MEKTNDYHQLSGEIQQLIDQGVAERESGNARKARAILSEAIRMASGAKNSSLVAKALGERIICNKHRYESTKLDGYLMRMEQDIQFGKLMEELREPQYAVFYLRQGDVDFSRGDYRSAEKEYWLAHSYVTKGGSEEAEYLGHLGQAKAMNGNMDNAIICIARAINIMRRIPSSQMERWHRHIILSGLFLRLVEVASKEKLLWPSASIAFLQGYTRALWLAAWYKKPVRLGQYHSLVMKFFGK